MESEEVFALDPAEKLHVEDSVLKRKLAEIRRTTPLLVRRKARIKTEGDRGWADGTESVKDVWEVAFGRIAVAPSAAQGQNVVGGSAGFGTAPIAPARLSL